MSRLARVLSAVKAPPEPLAPNTVERAFRPSFDDPDAGVPSPQLADAMGSGKIVTRRRVGHNLRPMPYPVL